MARKLLGPCRVKTCPNLSDCPEHKRERERVRGTRQRRGYDADYDTERRNYQRRMNRGEQFTCWRCAELGQPHLVNPNRWHLGHHNADRSIIRGPQCPESNLRDAVRHLN